MMSLNHDPSCMIYSKLPSSAHNSPHRVAFKPEAATEPVDLLRMVPDSTHLPQDSALDHVLVSPKHHVATRGSEVARRQGRLLSSAEDDTADESDTGVHVCSGCRNCSVYYNCQHRTLPGTSSPAMANAKVKARSLSSMASSDQDEGSVYFNYIQFSKNPHQPCYYEPVYKQQQKQQQQQQQQQLHSSHLSNPKCSLNCCKPVKQSCQYSPYKCANTTPLSNSKYMKNHRAESLQRTTYSSAGSTERLERSTVKNRLHLRKTTLRRWLVVAAILLGITVALVGLVVGFIVLGPYTEDQDGECMEGYAPCGEDTCVSIRHLCSGDARICPDINPQAICPQNATGWKTQQLPPITASMMTPASATPSATTPAQLAPDADGWITYAHGSKNGSKYTIINSVMPFNSAQDECRKRGGHLVHVNTVREQAFLMDYLHTQLEVSELYRDSVGFWLGARRARGSHSGSCMFDQWKWVDSYGRAHDVVRGFAAFMPGKPDDFFTPEECLFISYESSPDDVGYLMWNDAPCDIKSVGSIDILCEVELT